jgi:tetratricopeptide (TPR) repeat protein
MEWPRRIIPLLVPVVLMTTGTSSFSATPLDDAVLLQRQGRNDEAQRAIRGLLPDLRASGDRAALARALAAATEASLALGQYEGAIHEAQEAFDIHQQLGQRADAARASNWIGLANLYLGRYDDALASYERALALDRAGGDGDGEISRLNNIGNVHFVRGRYADALRLYQEAMATVDRRPPEGGGARMRKVTISNLAALHQRLGADERALDLYAQLPTGDTMRPDEEAQLLVNQGALIRRLGDPIKAVQTYRKAQALFARAQHRDGEIGAWRNMGIAYALDLNDNGRALDAFDAALKLARDSSNQRGEVQALLYRGETLRRMGRLVEAAGELQAALGRATRIGLVEERWKALYSLGRVVEAQGPRDEARQLYEQAITTIESVRADVRIVGLRSEFLADKREVYDALIAVRLSEPSPSAAELFELIERSRARTWQDRLQPDAQRLSLGDVQAEVAPDALLLEYWNAGPASALVWISSSASGIVKHAPSPDDIESVRRFADAVSRLGGDWQEATLAAGRVLLSGFPNVKGVTRLLVVPDGPLHFIPFEALTIPDTRELLVERFEVSYLPSAAFLVRRNAQPSRSWRWPWQRDLVAFGDPPPVSADPSPVAAAMPRLPYAGEEIRGIADVLPARSELHLGADAQKRHLLGQLRGVPLVHFSTHAIADTRDSDRSRILLAPREPGGPADHLFLREVYDLDLTGVQMVTLSACDTERGKVIRGEGVEGFSRALLAAGAASTVTTMWGVVDRASAEFMKQFYFALARGDSGASALRQAKLQFLRSDLVWSHPRYWAGYVLNGDGGERLARVIPWSVVAAALLLGALAAATGAYRFTAGRSRRHFSEPQAAGARYEVASIGSRGVTVHVPSSHSKPNTSIGSDEVTRTNAPADGITPSSSSDNSSARRYPFLSDRVEE